MHRKLVLTGAAALVVGLGAGALIARQASQRYVVGNALGLPIEPAADGRFAATSPNVKVYGAIYSAESCSYDPVRNLIVVPNRGVPQNVQVNNAWVSLLNHDGSVHTARWIGVQNAGAPRAALTPPLVLNEPYGSDIVKGTLYLADRDGSTGPDVKGVAVIRRFSMATGEPRGDARSGRRVVQRHRGCRRWDRVRDGDRGHDGRRRGDLAGLAHPPRRHGDAGWSRARRCIGRTGSPSTAMATSWSSTC